MADTDQDRIDINLSIPWLMLIAVGSIVFVTFFVYSNALDGAWGLDDYPNIVENEKRQMEELSYSSLKEAATSDPEGERVITNGSFALNYYFHGLDKTGYHLVNIIVHCLAAVGLFFFLYELLFQMDLRPGNGEKEIDEQKKKRMQELAVECAWVAALLWAVHPVLAQAVNYVVQRGVLLSGMFYLWALFVYLKARAPVNEKLNELNWVLLKRLILYGLSLLLFVFALKSKEVIGIFPLTLLLLEFVVLPGFPFPISSVDAKEDKWIFAGIGVGVTVFLFLLTAFYLMGGPDGIARRFHQIVDTSSEGSRYNVIERVMTEWRVMVFYISLLFYPSLNRLNLEHDISVSFSLFSPWTTVFSLMFILGLLFFALIYTILRYRKKDQVLPLSVFWFFLHLAVTSTVIKLELIFEHRLYLPAVGPILLVSWFIVRKLPIQFQVRLVWVVILCGLLGWTTYQRNKVWQSQVSLYADALEKAPSKPRNVGNLGVAKYRKAKRLEKKKEYKKAFELVEKAVTRHRKTLEMSEKQQRPIDQIFIENLDDLLIKQTKLWRKIEEREYEPNWTKRLIRSYRKILSFPSKYTDRRKALLNNLMNLHMHLAEIYFDRKMYKKTEKNLLQILQINSKHPQAHYRLAVLYKEKIPNKSKFRRHARKAIQYMKDGKLKEKVKRFLRESD